MALNAYQLISRVLPGKPFGDGRDGAITISANTTQSNTNRSCSGTSGGTTLNLGSSGFSNGDVVLIHQTRGTGAGAWEINMVSSGGGTSTLTTALPLAATYTDSGSSQAQVIKIPLYTTVTVNSTYTWNAPAWGGDTGGIFTFAARVAANIDGGFDMSGRGFTGGAAGNQTVNADPRGQAGEGTNGTGSTTYPTNGAANGNGGGGGTNGSSPTNGGTGGGGGNASAGSAGQSVSGATNGLGGDAAGDGELTSFVFGGGGGGAQGANEHSATGGNGGGGNFIFARELNMGASSFGHSYGNNGLVSSGSSTGAGGGAGGSTMLQIQTGSLGTNRFDHSPGIGGGGNVGDGGNGSAGRIALHYSNTFTGSNSSVAFNQTFDGRLIETSPGIIFFL